MPLALIRAAFILGSARRLSSPNAPLPPIRSLHYFLPILEEIQREPLDPDYVEYLRQRLPGAADGSPEPRRTWLQTSIFTE